MHLSNLFLYPVKSLRGCSVQQAEVDALGFVGDRRFLVTDGTGRFLTQRTLPAMAQIETALTTDLLTLRAPGADEITVGRRGDPAAELRSVTIWKSEGLLAEDCGEDVAQWLSRFLRTECRLVRIGEKFLRPILKPEVAGPGDLVAFADAYPFMATSEASLANLNDRLQENGHPPVDMDRFRPSFVIADSPPFAEDAWPRFRVGEITFRAAGPCARCTVITQDQRSGERLGPEPLRTLATYRRGATDPNRINFGQNLIHETKTGVLRVGDELTLL